MTNHGTAYAYNNGCHCDTCRSGHAARARARRAARRGNPPITPEDPRHGTVNAYDNLTCRCGRCREAKLVSKLHR